MVNVIETLPSCLLNLHLESRSFTQKYVRPNILQSIRTNEIFLGYFNLFEEFDLQTAF